MLRYLTLNMKVLNKNTLTKNSLFPDLGRKNSFL